MKLLSTLVFFFVSLSMTSQVFEDYQLFPEFVNPVASSDIGTSMDASGEWLVAGDYDDEPCGRAYVYKLVDGEWVLDISLTPSYDGDLESFGLRVAIDGNRMVIATREDEISSPYGALYIYRIFGNTWTLESYENNPFDSGTMGYELGLSDGMAVTTHWLGDNYEVAVFSQDENWNLHQTIQEPDGIINSFGNYVAVDGDDLIISARADTVDGVAQGALYHYQKIADEFVFKQKFHPPYVSDNDFTALAMHLSDGKLLVGNRRYGYAETEESIGRATLYELNQEGEFEVAQEFTPPFNQVDGGFGYDVSFNDDWMAISTVRVEQPNGLNSGATYMYEKVDGEWVFTYGLYGTDLGSISNNTSQFGRSVVVNDDNSVVVAAPWTEDEGELYVYNDISTQLVELPEASLLNIHPNPSNGVINISVENPLDIASVTLIDLTGREIRVPTSAMVFSEERIELDLKNVRSGQYALRMELSSGEVLSGKVILVD